MKFNKRDIPKSDGSGGNMFMRLKDGESVTGVCRGEVYEFFIIWENNRSRIVKQSEDGAKSRFRLNLVVHEDGKFIAKIWEFGLTIYNQLSDISDEYNLEETKLKISRRGVGTDTVYMILPLLKEPISPKTLKEISAVHMLILEHKPTVPKSLNPEEPEGWEE